MNTETNLSLIFRLINNLQTEPDPLKQGQANIQTNGEIIKHSLVLLGAVVVFAVVWGQVLNKPDLTAQSLPLQKNVQTMRVITPEMPHTRIALALGGTTDSIVDGVALLPETSPSDNGVSFSQDGEYAGSTKNEVSLYIIKDGDTLSDISELFDISVDTIIIENNLHTKKIKPGQEIRILPFSGVRHHVKRGDTIDAIAIKYDVEADDIRTFNGIKDDKALVVGNTLDIPGGTLAAPVEVKANTSHKGYRVASSKPNPRNLRSAGWLVHPLRGAGVKTQGIHGNNAVDYGAVSGTPIVAAASGSVIRARNSGWNGGYGNYVMIKHPNGATTVYAHMTHNIVSEGQAVQQGQVIGYVGTTGHSTGNHLHFEVRGGFRNPF